jgi:hypothetical protein
VIPAPGKVLATGRKRDRKLSTFITVTSVKLGAGDIKARRGSSKELYGLPPV